MSTPSKEREELEAINAAIKVYVENLKKGISVASAPENPGAVMLRKSATQDAPFEVDGKNYVQYLLSEHRKRQGFLLGMTTQTSRQTEPHYKTLARDHIKFTDMIRKDKDLNHGKWRFGYIRESDSGQCRRFMAHKIRISRIQKPRNLEAQLLTKDWKVGKEVKIPKVPIRSNFLNYLQCYKPPSTRILIISNITWNKHTPIPVYCDVTKTVKDLRVPPELCFEYVDKIIVNAYVEPEVAKAIEWSKRPNNHIKCNCLAEGLNCWENESCPCYQMNKRMQASQAVPRVAGQQTKFSSLNPILFNSAIDTYHRTFGFACSDECSCNGHCDNNAMYLIEKNIFPLEIYRADMAMGFTVRCKVLIPAGTPIMTFTGELNECRNSPDAHNAYSFKVTTAQDEFWDDLLVNTEQFDADYKKLLRSISWGRDFWIDPTLYGNVGRMAGHSCCPNMELVRVYKKSLSPAHMNLVLVALEDIYPGTPLSFDYGPGYADELKDCCRCSTFACIQNPEKEFMNLDPYNTSLCIMKIQNMRRRNFELGVLNVLEQLKNEQGSGVRAIED